MKYQINLSAPQDITVGEFINFSTARGDVKKVVACTDLTEEQVRELPRDVVVKTVEQFNELLSDVTAQDFPKVIELDGTKYGFEPNLKRLSTGAWADIAAIEDAGRNERLHQILAVLYRPVTQMWITKDRKEYRNTFHRIKSWFYKSERVESRNSPKYKIEEYDGTQMDNEDLFLDFKFSEALGVLAFFLTLHDGYRISLEMKMMEQLSKATEEMRKEICQD